MSIAYIIVIYLFLVLLCFSAPFWVRLLLFAVNFVLPDPIPVVDEVLMGAGVVSKVVNITRVLTFLQRYWWVIVLPLIGISVYFLSR